MSRPAQHDAAEGVLIIDKPQGSTSHDVVAAVRRRLQQRRVGHAGTLDPLATGVLVVMVGEATKLAPYLTGHDKCYRAEIQLGWATDSLDADGTPTASRPRPGWWTDDASAMNRVAAALEAERSRTEQQPPALSAIKLRGRPAHRRVRAGEQVTLSPRPVQVRQLELLARRQQLDRIELELTVGKGYYVRSLARDLGDALGWPAHLRALRRLRSGPFTIGAAAPLDAPALDSRLLSTARTAVMALPRAVLTSDGAKRARHGGPMELAHFARVPDALEPSAWLDEQGRLHAIGELREGTPCVLRGFTTPTAL